MKTTLRISEDLSERLSALAKSEHQSESSLASEAIEEFLNVRQWHIQAISEGIEAADRGGVVSHEEAVAELKKWGNAAY
ncbi:CopG family ribbon-helix-helix protein [Candidatus Magnetomonas plexicatena]|uniref:CopG family ribbon-helix-helix protein n=1 Tax=Candidatus Magnetomonas plexicatena TaxID=2552947 RepID=UPI001C766EFF|nr:CopG family transcriptional regulator [Nitrospirales bacterium LBB_01]